jgi:hypothetical protein
MNNRIALFFTIDVVIASIVFWIFLAKEVKKHMIRFWWISIILNLSIGLSAALPFFLFLKEIYRGSKNPNLT